MLPDVVDDFASENPSYANLQPLFFSCYAFCCKLAGSLAAGISAMTLQSVKVLSAHSRPSVTPSRPPSFCVQVCQLQSRRLFPRRQSVDGSDRAVLSGPHRASAHRDGHLPLLPHR